MANIAITANTGWYIYNFRKNTILKLLELGHKVYIVAPIDNYEHKLIQLGCVYIDINIDRGGTNPIYDFITFLHFIRVYKSNSINITLNFTPKNNIYSTLAAKFFNIKVINNIAGLGLIFINESFKTKCVKFLYKFSQTKADLIFFQNQDDRNLFFTNGIANNTPTIRLPGSGVDLTRFKITPSDDNGVVRFLLIARMLYDKGILHFVEAARDLTSKYGSKVEFCLLGFLDVDNPSAITSNKMSEWVSEGIITYLGVSDNVENEIGLADCIVLPSYYREGVPKSLLEAGAMGKPIVTTDNVGCRETVEHGVNGYLCEMRSTSSLISCLNKVILLSHDQRLVMGQASRTKIVSEFDEVIVIQEYVLAINKLLNEK
jgi:glycosyltransferase involved in cell wall biosynthesis